MNVTFNDLPFLIAEIDRKLNLLLSANQKSDDTDGLFTIDELIEFLPEHPAKQTVYQWITGRLIPYQKHGKRLYFRKSEIKNWLSNGRVR